MRAMRRNTAVGQAAMEAAMLLCALTVGVGAADGQGFAIALTPQTVQPAAPQTVQPAAPPPPAGTELDRVVAIVNGDLILDSDVDEEARFEALQPYRDAAGPSSRGQQIERLINRTLILQQAALQPQDAISDADVDRELDGLRKSIPECKKYACETKAGWDSFLSKNGFTEAMLRARWRQRMEVLAFIERRFRAGTTISDAQVNEYYTKTMLPEYAKQHVAPPALDSLQERIREVLLQSEVSSLLSDWLKSLRAQGSVTVLHPGEEAP